MVISRVAIEATRATIVKQTRKYAQIKAYLLSLCQLSGRSWFGNIVSSLHDKLLLAFDQLLLGSSLRHDDAPSSQNCAKLVGMGSDFKQRRTTTRMP
jgi:hypothetical protein